MEKMNTLDLTKKLISIPSYVGSGCNEQKIGEFVYQYLKQFKWLKVVKQFVGDGRFNVIAFDKYPTTLLLNGHLDTVQPRSGWNTKPLDPTLKNNNLYGLGAADMKGNIAAMLSALTLIQNTKGLMIFLYVDEEYDFLGMREFIKQYKNKIKPQLIVSGDGGNLEIGNGCRGLIEIKFVLKGETGHAGRPQLGKNAILISNQAVDKLIKVFETNFRDPELGKSSCNLAFIQGGLDQGRDNSGNLILGKEGNNIADIAEFIVDIRPATSSLNAKKVIQLTRGFVEKQGAKVIQAKIRHDLGSWITPKSDLKEIEKILESQKFTDLGQFGYIDTQMLWRSFGKVPAFMLGAGSLAVAHKPNEYVPVSNLQILTEKFKNLIFAFAKGGEKNHGKS